MGARHSLYTAGPEDVVDPQRPGAAEPAGAPAAARPPPIAVPDPSAATSRNATGGGAAGLVSRLGLPLCSTVDTVDLAATHPHSPLPSPAAHGLTDVWILAGQSNAVGDNAADGLPMPAAAQPLPGLVLSYDGGVGTSGGGSGGSGGRWVDAAPNVHLGLHGYEDADSCGPGIPFGRTLVSLGLSARVALVPTARGSTNLFHDWRPVTGSSSSHSSAAAAATASTSAGGAGSHSNHSNGGAASAAADGSAAAGAGSNGGAATAATATTATAGDGGVNAASGVKGGSPPGYFYAAMIARVKAAMATPLPGGGACRLRGMVWVQGEADAEERHGPGPAEAYAANFSAFVAAARRDLSAFHAQLPVIVGVMAVRKRDCFPHLPAVRQAQLNVPLPGLIRIDMAGFEFFEEYGPYHVHLTKDGACAMGAAMAHSYYSAVVRAGLPRGPPGSCAVGGPAACVAPTPAAGGAAAASFRQQQHQQQVLQPGSTNGGAGVAGGVVGVALALATIPSSDSPRSGVSAATPLATAEAAAAEPAAAEVVTAEAVTAEVVKVEAVKVEVVTAEVAPCDSSGGVEVAAVGAAGDETAAREDGGVGAKSERANDTATPYAVV